MTQMKCTMDSVGTGRRFIGRFMALFLIAASGLTAHLPSQTAVRGALELTSGLGRKLYALPDEKAVIDARKSLAADPKNVSLVLLLAHAQAAQRQYREAVATATAGL